MTREERRKAMPITAAFIDEMRALFGEPAYIKAEENACAIEWGVKEEGIAVYPVREFKCEK